MKVPRAWLLGSAAAALATVAAAAVAGARPVLDAYLVSVAFWLDLALGALGVTLLHALTGGRWGGSALPALGALTRLLAPLAVAMLPLALAYRTILPLGAELPEPQRLYFAPAWLWVRFAIYFAVWIGAAMALRARHGARRTAAASAAAVPYALATTLFAVDWLASSRPDSTGTIVGFVLVAGQLAAALAFAIVLAAPRSSAARPASADRRQDLANLLLAACMFYGYVLVMQLLVVWSANLPREIEWYLARAGAVGITAALGIAACHALAIALLCSRRVKRDRRALLCVAALVLLGHLCDTYWWLAPLLDASASRVLDLPMIAAVGLGCWAAATPRRAPSRLAAEPQP